MDDDKRDGQTIYHDEFGVEYALDADGNRVPPRKAAANPDDGSGFTTYPTERGHCGLCGRLGCRGGCFK